MHVPSFHSRSKDESNWRNGRIRSVGKWHSTAIRQTARDRITDACHRWIERWTWSSSLYCSCVGITRQGSRGKPRTKGRTSSSVWRTDTGVSIERPCNGEKRGGLESLVATLAPPPAPWFRLDVRRNDPSSRTRSSESLVINSR